MAGRPLACAAVLCAVLSVASGQAGAPAPAATEGRVWLWTPNPLIPVYREPAYTDKRDTVCLLRLMGARNGAVSGQVVVCTDQPTALTRAAASDLKATTGQAIIPASAILIRYALATVAQKDRLKQFPGLKTLTQFDALAEAPGEAAKVQPVWVTVTVPADAAPGDYAGTLTVQPAAGGPLSVPIRLSVSGWRVPDAEAFTGHAGFIQSPDSVALEYQVPLWSEKHFDLIGRSFHYLGQLGNKVLYIPLLCHTHFGNEETMVRWIAPPGVRREGPTSQPTSFPAGTTFTHDFSVLERYLEVCEKNAGRPKIVCLYVWDYSIGGDWWGDPKQHSGAKPARVSVLDPATGKTEMIEGPVHGTPESEALWKPAIEGIHQRLAKRGYPDDAILFGIGGDKRPDKPTVEMFKRIAPYARWVSNSHGRILDFYGTPVGYVAHVWGVGLVVEPEKQRKYGWQGKIPITVFPRYGGGKFVIHPPLYMDSPLATHRMIWEGTTMAGLIGVGRCGADFWPVLSGKRGAKERILGRYPEASWGQLGITNATAEILHPGPEGALATIRFEMMREGLQEAEARIFIEKALVNKDLRAKLGDERAARLQAILDARVHAYLKAFGDLSTAYQTAQQFAQGDWQARDGALFSAAAEVAAALRAP